MASGDIRKLVFLGVGLVSGGHTEEAIKALSFARETGSQHFDRGAASRWLALALCFEGQPEQAEPIAREAVDNPITQYNANMALILSLIGQGRTEEAV